MRQLFLIIVILLTSFLLQGQAVVDEIPEGSISFITSQSVYVKFRSTASISIGDTLFMQMGDKLVPALLVNNLSSMSAVCSPISDLQFNVNNKIAYNISYYGKDLINLGDPFVINIPSEFLNPTKIFAAEA